MGSPGSLSSRVPLKTSPGSTPVEAPGPEPPPLGNSACAHRPKRPHRRPARSRRRSRRSAAGSPRWWTSSPRPCPPPRRAAPGCARPCQARRRASSARRSARSSHALKHAIEQVHRPRRGPQPHTFGRARHLQARKKLRKSEERTAQAIGLIDKHDAGPARVDAGEQALEHGALYFPTGEAIAPHISGGAPKPSPHIARRPAGSKRP